MTDQGSYHRDMNSVMGELSQIDLAMEKLVSTGDLVYNMDTLNVAMFIHKRCEAIRKIYKVREEFWDQDLTQMEKEHKRESLGYK